MFLWHHNLGLVVFANVTVVLIVLEAECKVLSSSPVIFLLAMVVVIGGTWLAGRGGGRRGCLKRNEHGKQISAGGRPKYDSHLARCSRDSGL